MGFVVTTSVVYGTNKFVTTKLTAYDERLIIYFTVYYSTVK